MILLALFQSKRLEFLFQLLGLLLLLLLLPSAIDNDQVWILVYLFPSRWCKHFCNYCNFFDYCNYFHQNHLGQGNTCIFISALRLHQVYVLGLAVNQDSNGGVDLCSSFLDRN